MVKKKKRIICHYFDRYYYCDVIHDWLEWSFLHHNLISSSPKKKKEKPQIMLMWHLLGYLPNKHVFLHLKNKICWPGHLYSTTVSHYIMLFCHTCYIYQNTTSLTHLGRACAHVMRLRLQQQPEFDSDLRPYAMSPPLKLQLCYQRKAIGYLDDFSINYTVLLEICIVIDNTISEVWDPKQLF